MYHSPQGPELVPVEPPLGANLPSPAGSPPPLQSPERSSCWQAAVAMTSRRRTACLIWLITGKVPGVHTDVLLPQSGGKELTLLEYSLFSRVLSRPPVILAVTRADGQHHLTVTGEETEAETEGLAQGQDRRVSECMLGASLWMPYLLRPSAHLLCNPHSQFPVISVLNCGQGQSRWGHLKEADMSRKQPSHPVRNRSVMYKLLFYFKIF